MAGYARFTNNASNLVLSYGDDNSDSNDDGQDSGSEFDDWLAEQGNWYIRI